LIKKAVIYIRKNLYENISLKDIAGELHVNSSYLSRVFKKNIGQNITEYIHESKINESLALVKSKSHEIIEIANIFGYCNTAYFSTQFKKVMGISPREFQKTNN
jgi:two-component system response regulator YesN